MKEILLVIIFAICGILALKFFNNSQKRSRKQNNSNDNMSRNDFYQPYKRTERQTSGLSQVDG